MMVIGGIAWVTFGSVCFAYITSMDPGTTRFRLLMRALNTYAEANALPQEMRVRLRDFFHRTKHLQQSQASAECLVQLSPALQGEVLFRVNFTWINRGIKMICRRVPY